MPNFSIYFDDDTYEWLEKEIGKGKVSSYLLNLVQKDRCLIRLSEERRKLEVVKDIGLSIVGFSFILFVLLSSFIPDYSLMFFSFSVLLGGVLLLVTGFAKSVRSVKNGTINTSTTH